MFRGHDTARPSDARIADARRLDALRRQLSDERRRRWQAEDESERALQSAGILSALATGSVELPPIVPHRTGKSHDPAVPVLLVSDVHVGERVRSASVNGLNEYDDEIAERRMAFLFEGFAWHVERHAQFYSVNEAVLWLGGDLIAGLIHEEQAASNCLMTPPAVMLAQELIARGIDYLLGRCRFLRRVRVVCSFGNHGRVTKQVWRSIRPETSYEWIIYHGLRSRFSREPRVEWQIADGPLTYAEIFGLTFRFTHGDSVGYQGGIGGLTIPLKKRCLAWDKSRRADVTVLGHFHQLHHWGYATVNGSVVGWNPYAADVGCEYELPKQGLLLVTDWGVQTFTEVYCDPDRAPKDRAVA